ncbi:amino acid adenylation domain-containing protein [Fontibacillus phaseoli]|uniref:Amino acid adenylation domain-containing protein n=1 Tax=Fontibacillus phaseoli TaxID=1416533 RepID=A0A369BCG2_9BACL|nr:non-ribosomal peptide synthetase [Fontibacillus phaseoli]RCX18147.1 amino acid adenylation domain-containing protein [Fontibacillus phaseoli]
MDHHFSAIYKMFEDVASRYSDHCCLEFGETRLSYGEVNERANRLARYLKDKGAGPEQLIGIYLERSPDLIVSILAVLKSGAAYVPINAALPEERIAHMVGEAKLKLILSKACLESKINAVRQSGAASSTGRVLLDQESDEISALSGENLELNSAPSDLAYVIYTSGSTGQPKGVQIEHRGIPNLVLAQIDKFHLDDRDRVLQYASLSFDASVSEIFTALIAGATLVLLPGEGTYAGEDLHRLLKDRRISVVTLVPSLLNGLPQEELPQLKTLITAGEACTRKLIQYWAPRVRFLNAYGPTETTVCATIHHCTADDISVSLGEALTGSAVYLLNARMEPVRPGEIGELFISSLGLARGYLDAQELTDKVFLDNPFDDGFSNRLYRTGDLCVTRPDGALEWVGRTDHQVKVSGIRVELGELEHALREYAGIEEAVVVYHAEKNYVGAYLKAAYGAKPNIREVRSYLLSKFPSYMIPTRYLYLEQFALLTSGKIDRHHLPSMEDVRPDLDVPYVAPSSYLEKELAAIWGEVLHLDKVGVHDNFFELGGQSLMATQIVSRIRGVVGGDVPLHIIFGTQPTIEQMAATLEQYQLEQLDPDELELLLAELENQA